MTYFNVVFTIFLQDTTLNIGRNCLKKLKISRKRYILYDCFLIHNKICSKIKAIGG